VTRGTTTRLLRYARAAGLAYVAIIVVAVLNTTLIDARLLVAGDNAATASNIVANELTFRVGIVATLLMYAAVFVLSLALYQLLKEVNRGLALLALLFRSAEATLGSATVLFSLLAVQLLNQASGLDNDRGHALLGLFLDVRTAGLDVVLVFVGLGGALFCYLFWVSRCVPRLFAGWGVVTYLSMLALGVVSILYPKHPALLEIVPYSLGALFELLFGIWLTVKGVDVSTLTSGVELASESQNGEAGSFSVQ